MCDTNVGSRKSYDTVPLLLIHGRQLDGVGCEGNDHDFRSDIGRLCNGLAAAATAATAAQTHAERARDINTSTFDATNKMMMTMAMRIKTREKNIGQM